MAAGRVQRGVLRLLVVAGPLLAVFSAGAEHRPPPLLVVVVGLLSLGWALAPEAPVGSAVLVIVLAWWGLAPGEVLGPEVLGPEALAAAAALLAAHVAAVLVAYAPARTPLQPALVRRWLWRAVALFVAAPTVLLAGRLVTSAAEPPLLWLVAATAAVSAILVAAVLVGPGADALPGQPRSRG